MVYYITGSNIFQQWSWDVPIINEFRAITESKNLSAKTLLHLKLLHIQWSYNIWHFMSTFYVTGAWNGKENQFVVIPLPADYIKSSSDLITGNDKNILLISNNTSQLWVIDLKLEQQIKKIKFNIEIPVENDNKRQKRDNNICKVVLVNDSCLYMTSLGNVYCGILPSYVDTRHCRGTVCDIQCGYEHYLLLTDAGTVYTWGNGRRLQLGHGDVSNLHLPTEVEALAGIKITKICAGGWHSLALSEFGDLYVWGWNDTGQLGIKEKDNQSCPIPKLVDLFDNNGEEVTVNIKDIACGSKHSAILLDDNTVWTSGCNKYGQLGFSEEKYPVVCYFKKAFQSNKNSLLMCGPWATVVVK